MAGFGGKVLVAVPVHGADTEPGTDRAEPCRVCLSKYLDFLLFASKQSKACFSTESGKQFSTTQICMGECTAAQSGL